MFFGKHVFWEVLLILNDKLQALSSGFFLTVSKFAELFERDRSLSLHTAILNFAVKEHFTF